MTTADWLGQESCALMGSSQVNGSVSPFQGEHLVEQVTLVNGMYVPHLWKHSEYFLVDVKDPTRIYFIFQLRSQRSVLLGGKEEGWGIAALGQSRPGPRRGCSVSQAELQYRTYRTV